jgi:hypothetical protein
MFMSWALNFFINRKILRKKIVNKNAIIGDIVKNREWVGSK